MDFGSEGVERSFEEIEQDAEAYQERSENLEQRELELSNALSKLENDAQVTKSLERNERDIEMEREDVESERMSALESLSSIEEALEQLDESNERSDAALDSLRELGEDVSGAESVIESRRRWLEECYQRIEHLYEILGEDFEKIGDLSRSSTYFSNAAGEHGFGLTDGSAEEMKPPLRETQSMESASPTLPPCKLRDESARSSQNELFRKIPPLQSTTQEVRYLENGNTVFDSPMETGLALNFDQGKAVWRYCGTCGLCSCENVARLAGKDITEADVINLARKNRLCKRTLFKTGINGGTYDTDRQDVLRVLGIDSYLDYVHDVNHIAQLVESGRGVIAAVDVGTFWPRYPLSGSHAVTITSVERDPAGIVTAFYVCDSGSGGNDFARRVDSSLLEMSLLKGVSLNVTTGPIR